MSSTSSLSNLCISKEFESWISNPETRMVSLPGLTWDSVLWEIIAGILITIPSFPRAFVLAIEEPSLDFVSGGIFQSLKLKGHQEGDSSSVNNLEDQTKYKKVGHAIFYTCFFNCFSLYKALVSLHSFLFHKYSMKQKEQKWLSPCFKKRNLRLKATGCLSTDTKLISSGHTTKDVSSD